MWSFWTYCTRLGTALCRRTRVCSRQGTWTQQLRNNYARGLSNPAQRDETWCVYVLSDLFVPICNPGYVGQITIWQLRSSVKTWRFCTYIDSRQVGNERFLQIDFDIEHLLQRERRRLGVKVGEILVFEESHVAAQVLHFRLHRRSPRAFNVNLIIFPKSFLQIFQTCPTFVNLTRCQNL